MIFLTVLGILPIQCLGNGKNTRESWGLKNLSRGLKQLYEQYMG